MNKALFTLSLFILASLYANSQVIHHNLFVDIDINKKSIIATDSIEIPLESIDTSGFMSFVIGSNFEIDCPDTMFQILFVSKHAKTIIYKIIFPDSLPEKIILPLKYSGIIEGEIEKGGSEYSQSFSYSDGIISEKGIFLSGATNWIPYFDDLFTYKLTTGIDMAWSVISQGKLLSDDISNDKKQVVYDCKFPMEEIYLIGGKFHEYKKMAGEVEVLAYLRSEDEELAYKYLDKTGEYMAMYEKMIAPYPFSKFALIENFWETGYGMPSFTLLGPKVIRFPWIIRTSYPHELLHNWWGNGVFVDYEKGNWCEGITAYMADHLFAEMTGGGKNYRMTQLQKYNDFVNEGNDFPLSEFISRNNSSEQAIGYSKALMIYHMLRMDYGDEKFLQAWQHFYENNKFTQASFDDLQKSFEFVTGDDLSTFFKQWTTQTGTPEFVFYLSKVNTLDAGVELIINVQQKQEGNAYEINVPVVFYIDGQEEPIVKRFKMTKKSENFTVAFDKRPYKIDFDPEFDLFRKLDPEEVPVTFSKIFGAKKTLITIPINDPNVKGYETLANQWKINAEKEGNKVDIRYDNAEITANEYDAVWIFGIKNKFKLLNEYVKDYKALMPVEDLKKFDELLTDGTLAYVIPNPDKKGQVYGFFNSTEKVAFKNVSSRLPHYGKYSYVGFQGEQSLNALKGFFEVTKFPLRKIIDYSEDKENIGIKLPERLPLYVE